MAHPLVELARKSINSYVRDDVTLDAPAQLTDEMKQKAGVFVSIHKGDDLRGCIGTFAPTKENIAKEIIANAISAAVQDPRFPPIEEDELDALDISVDVLSSSEPVKNLAELDAKKFGVIVKSGYIRGLLLPDLDGVDTPQQQIDICRRKGGIGEREPVELFKFSVNRYL